MYSHRTFRATAGTRTVLAILGLMAFQGSIKWWCLRHRLHHRFTDDPVHDPYAATKGLLFSHVGWIFFKPAYEKLESVERKDLEDDPVVRIQHRFYIEGAIISGLILPTFLGWLWGDPKGGFIWAGLIARVMIWHCTFLVNSFAHWDGLQQFSDETSAKGNLTMALLTCGEGNHNFHHAFPYDFRSGPALTDWDPSKWIINLLSYLGLVYQVRRARTEDIYYALEYMNRKQKRVQEPHHNDLGNTITHPHKQPTTPVLLHEGQMEKWDGPVWSRTKACDHVKTARERCFITVDDYFIDVTHYMKEHPGGAKIFRPYSIRVVPTDSDAEDDSVIWQDATWAFQNHNYHSLMAKRRLRQLAIAKILELEDTS